MKRIWITLWIFSSLVLAQPDENTKRVNPCDHPVLEKARNEGLNSLSLKQIPQFWFRAWRCTRYAKREGQKSDFRLLYEQKQEENYEEARKLSGLGTSCLTVTAIILFYSYFGYFMSAGPT